MEPLLSTPQAARILGKSPSTLDSWRSLRRGPAYLLVEGTVRYSVDDLRKYIDASRVNSDLDVRAAATHDLIREASSVARLLTMDANVPPETLSALRNALDEVTR